MGLFYLVRHGETEWNAGNRLCGRSDVPLSDAGRRQAARLAQRLKPLPLEAMYSSPLKRALQTASIIAESIGLEPIVNPSLIELDYGSWEGKTYAEVRAKEFETYRAWDADPGKLAPPGGESGEQALKRAAPFLDLLTSRHPQGNVVVVGHRTVWRLIVCHILGLAPSEYRRRLVMDNACMNIIQWWEQGWRLVLLNDTSHLAEPLSEPAPTIEDF